MTLVPETVGAVTNVGVLCETPTVVAVALTVDTEFAAATTPNTYEPKSATATV